MNPLCIVALLAIVGPIQAFAQAPAAKSGRGDEQATARNSAGAVNLVEGDSKIQAPGAGPRPAKVGDAVREGDTLMTGKDGEIHVTMEDSGFIALRSSTTLKVLHYKATGGDEDESLLGLLVGGFRSVSGWIGKYNRGRDLVRTPNATIGIRGTDHETHYVPEGSSSGESGTYDKVYAGETTIQDASGTAAVPVNKVGFLAARRGVRPRLLDGTPKFFVPSRHEAEIALKHDQILRIIDQKREERRRVILEKRAAVQSGQEKMQNLREQTLGASQERLKAAEEQRSATLARQRELEQERLAIQSEERALQDRRRALMQQIAEDRISPDAARAPLKELRAQEAKLKERRRVLNEKSETLRKQNAAAMKERLEAEKSDRRALAGERKEQRESREDLKAERKSAQAELKGMRKEERERYLEELKAERQKRKAEGGMQE